MILYKKRWLTGKEENEWLLEDKKVSATVIGSMLDGLWEMVWVLLDLTGKCSHYNKTLLQGHGDEVDRETENFIVLTQYEK